MEIKRVLVLEGAPDERERRIKLENIFGKDVQMVPVKNVASIDELRALITSKGPGVVMVEAEIMSKMILAEAILKFELHKTVQIRELLKATYLDDDKITWLQEFRNYSEPLTQVEFK